MYLPAETLREHDVDPEQILALEFDENVEAAMRTMLARTEALYREGVAGIRFLPEDCQLAVLFAAVLYADYHRLIRKRGYDTVSATPALGTARSIWLYLRTRWHWRWSDDPETVFRKVVSGFESVPRWEQSHGQHTVTGTD